MFPHSIQRSLSSTIQHDGYAEAGDLTFADVDIWGVEGTVSSVSVNGQEWQDFNYSEAEKVKICPHLNFIYGADF